MVEKGILLSKNERWKYAEWNMSNIEFLFVFDGEFLSFQIHDRFHTYIVP